jgi:hypothetical protein
VSGGQHEIVVDQGSRTRSRRWLRDEALVRAEPVLRLEIRHRGDDDVRRVGHVDRANGDERDDRVAGELLVDRRGVEDVLPVVAAVDDGGSSGDRFVGRRAAGYTRRGERREPNTG